MKMQLIQPFISATDCVLATALHGPTTIGDLSMERDGYEQKGCAVRVAIHGEIEGRIILDMTPDTALRVAGVLTGEPAEESAQVVTEAVFELANMIIGNAVTLLNDHGYQFKVLPPERHVDGRSAGSKSETEETVIYFDTACGRVFLNINMRYHLRPRADHVPVLSSQP